MVALVNGSPKLLNIKEVLEQFFYHRREVIIRRTAYELRKAEEKAHILLGLRKAVENADDVVDLIRKAPDTPTAHAQLKEKFELSDIQAKAILDMRLARLTGLEREKIVKEHAEIVEYIRDLQDILDRPDRVVQIITDDLQEVRELYGDDRRSEVIESEADEYTMEALVADEEVAVTVTHAGYIKRTPLDEIRAQKRGGKGRMGMKTRAEDLVSDLFITSNHQSLLCFTSLGRVYSVKVYRLPEVQLAGRGKHFANLLKLNENEKVVSVLPVKEFVEGNFIISVTKRGYVKKTDIMSYSNLRITGIIGLKLDDGDELVSCSITDGESDILIGTSAGKAIRFHEGDCRPMGRGARGVTGIRFGNDDEVIGLEVLKGKDSILSVCENGYGKRTLVEEYRRQSRGGKGILTIKVTDRNGPVVGLMQVAEDDQLMVLTSGGKVTRFNVSEVGVIGRNTQGVKLIKVEEAESVISVAKIATLEGEEV